MILARNVFYIYYIHNYSYLYLFKENQKQLTQQQYEKSFKRRTKKEVGTAKKSKHLYNQ